MPESKCSRLNPLASTFVPGKIVESGSIREIAEKYVNDLIDKKESKGNKPLTKIEMANLVGQLISLRFNNSDFRKINRYLVSKVLYAEVPGLKPISEAVTKMKADSSVKSFDLSKFPLPKQTYLVVSFWGLYRHEQSERPLLSLTYRPELVTDKVWSIASTDMKLWNPFCVENICNCPPMFGYIIPSTFFGNPSHLHYACSEPGIHLNHYAESVDGTEYTLVNNTNYNSLDEQPFVEDLDDFVNAKIDIDTLTGQFVNLIADLCNLLEKLGKDSDNDTEDSKTEEGDQSLDFWDDFDSEPHITFDKQKPECLVDDNIHPLLVDLNFEEDEGVSLEIEEMIRRSLSPKKEECSSKDTASKDETLDLTETCDPPCSVWCKSAKKTKKDKDLVIKVNLLPPNCEDLNDIPVLDLLSPELLESSKPKPETFTVVDVKPVLDDLELPKPFPAAVPKPTFRRSFSVNDCDPHYYEEKFGFNGAMGLASEDFLKFIKKDPANFFKMYNRSTSWKDTDSGFVSHWSSQEDLFGDRSECCGEQDDRSSMWGLFSGEDSLWKPLPECATPSTVEEKPIPHRRVRDLRRQRSLN